MEGRSTGGTILHRSLHLGFSLPHVCIAPGAGSSTGPALPLSAPSPLWGWEHGDNGLVGTTGAQGQWEHGDNGSTGTGLGHGGVATLPSEDEHPSCTTTAVSSASCSSARPLQSPFVALWGLRAHPGLGRTHLHPGKGTPTCISIPGGQSVRRAGERSIIGMAFWDTLIGPGASHH